MRDLQPVRSPVLLNPTVEVHVEHLVRTLNEPNLSAGQPVVRQFHLPAVHNLLLEQPELIPNGEPHRIVVLTRQRIHKTRRKPPEPAVSESRVRFQLIEVLEFHAVIRERLPHDRLRPEIGEVVAQRFSEQKLHTEVIDAFRPLGARAPVKILSLLEQNIPNRHRGRLIYLIDARLLGRHPEIAGEFPVNPLLHGLLAVFLHSLLKKCGSTRRKTPPDTPHQNFIRASLRRG